MTTSELRPPASPICRSSGDARAPCRFSGTCHETRQRIAHYQDPPLRGSACWAFQQLEARLGSEAQAERSAIQAEVR